MVTSAPLAPCQKTSDAQALPSSIFQCEYQVAYAAYTTEKKADVKDTDCTQCTGSGPCAQCSACVDSQDGPCAPC